MALLGGMKHVRSGIASLGLLGLLGLGGPGTVVAAPPEEGGTGLSSRTFKVTFYCSCAKCCGKYSPQRGGTGNTALGHSPLAFRTVAVGDRSLLGKWIFFEDLGTWAYAADTGASCVRPRKQRNKRDLGCVAANQVDIFIGGPEMHRHALRLGVMEWKGRILEKEKENAEIREQREGIPAEVPAP